MPAVTGTEIAVIGGGPVGLLLANLLGRRGHSVIVLERRSRPYPLPRAIHFDGEAMRAFQAAGLAGRILPHTRIGKGMLFKNRAGDTLVDWSRAQRPGPMGWHESYRFYQPGVEAALRGGLDRFDRVTLRAGADVTGIAQTPDRVELTLADGERLHTGFAVGCDGAQSFTRGALGVGLHDLGFQERWLVVDLVLTAPRPDLGDHTVQFCDPDAPATYGRGVGNRRRFEMRLSPEDSDPPDDAAVWARLSRRIAAREARLERAAVYTFRSRIAQVWHRGRVLLAGDAAHQMPPFMGQGLCAGIRDAANLAWKLAAVLNGAEAALLDSYQTEREPNARAFIEASMALGRLINQTAAGAVPQGRMASIWPDLGPGLGPRDGTGGALAPQVTAPGGIRADDAAGGGFYLITEDDVESDLPRFAGGRDWLRDKGVAAAILRPDGYCLAGASDPADLRPYLRQASELNRRLREPDA